ncbi:glycosyltransferase [Arthrobacter liuii]|uniref:Glycosyl transferase n=1 Tax=Arthrobacter liuii TaxID=1476996 RepID=A0ABQ2AGN0_9MICC|nr:glycosyltransferase [Arthrobacter liuii]GGH91066.1 glycosyl transferase [Arthrobacter liuii]
MRRSVAIIGTRGYPSYYGGFETAVRHLAPYLARNGWDVTVYGRAGAVRLDDPTREKLVTSRNTPGLETKSLSTMSHGLTATVDAIVRKHDVALIMNVANGFWLPLLWIRGIPSVVNVDGIEWDRQKWGRVAKNVFKAGAAFTARFATRLVYDAIAISERWERDFHRGGDFIPYGGTKAASVDPGDGLLKRQYVLLVARFVPENTVPQFLKAVELLPDEVQVVIVGSSGYGGELENQTQALVDERPNVRWEGHVSDDARLFGLWQNAGVYFHGHSVGGTNPALVQAMMCGAPTLALDTIYNREVLGDTGQFTSSDPHEIASAIMRLLNDDSERERLSKLTAERAIDYYSWEGVLAKYEESLITALKGWRS